MVRIHSHYNTHVPVYHLHVLYVITRNCSQSKAWQSADHLFYNGNQQNLTSVQSIKMSTPTPIKVLNSILSFHWIQSNLTTCLILH